MQPTSQRKHLLEYLKILQNKQGIPQIKHLQDIVKSNTQ